MQKSNNVDMVTNLHRATGQKWNACKKEKKSKTRVISHQLPKVGRRCSFSWLSLLDPCFYSKVSLCYMESCFTMSEEKSESIWDHLCLALIHMRLYLDSANAFIPLICISFLFLTFQDALSLYLNGSKKKKKNRLWRVIHLPFTKPFPDFSTYMFWSLIHVRYHW